jgi:hypothetical protein
LERVMQTKLLGPHQIITFNDYPVHNEQILRIYFKIYQEGVGRIIPPVPVISLDLVQPQIKNPRLAEFLNHHPDVEYFLLDGSHKTTAATLAGQPILVMVFSTDDDIQEAIQMADRGYLISLTTGKTVNECIKVLQKHFRSPAEFQTVLEKTNRMVSEKFISKYMVEYFMNQENRPGEQPELPAVRWGQGN